MAKLSGSGEFSQFAEARAMHLLLEVAEWKKWPTDYTQGTDYWTVASVLQE